LAIGTEHMLNILENISETEFCAQEKNLVKSKVTLIEEMFFFFLNLNV